MTHESRSVELNESEVCGLIAKRLEESGQVKHRLALAYVDTIRQAAALIVETLTSGHKLLLFGNGGSAADAQHIAAEFVGRYSRDRAPLAAIALTTDSSVLTAISNDYRYRDIFARQVRALGRPGDLAIGISTSGNSSSVIDGLVAARELGMRTVALTGRGGGGLVERADVPIVVPSQVTARIQEAHITIGHILCEIVDAQLFGVLEPVASRTPASMKIAKRSELAALRQEWARQRLRVVSTNGCFDVLHVGHVRSLQAAKGLGDVLVVGVNDDASVAALKGAGRPLVPAEDRAELLASLECVDFVVVFEELTPEAFLADLCPDVHCKGGDYGQSGERLPERTIVEACGGRIEVTPYFTGHSTTNLIERARDGVAKVFDEASQP